MIRITVPWDVSRTSANQRLHWRKRAALNARARECARIAWYQAGRPKAAGPVAVSITVRRGRLLDPDNALSGAKACIDGLFNDAITPKDSAEWVCFRPVVQETGKRFYRAEEVVFEVTDAANSAL